MFVENVNHLYALIGLALTDPSFLLNLKYCGGDNALITNAFSAFFLGLATLLS